MTEAPQSWTIAPERVTLAIEGFNAADLQSEALFRRTLGCLRAQTYPAERCEVLVVLDAAQADQVPAMRGLLPEASFLLVPEVTYYEGKNLVAEVARGDIVVHWDSDIDYEPEALAALLSCFDDEVDLVVGNTLFDEGALRDPLSYIDWAAYRPESGWTDRIHVNQLAARREVFRRFPFPTDISRCGEAGAEPTRLALIAAGVRPWFCHQARGRHHLPPVAYKQFRYGAHGARLREVHPQVAGGWLYRVPLAGPGLVVLGTLVKALYRVLRFRAELRRSGWGLASGALALVVAKLGELAGAYAYAYAWGLFRGRFDWFELPRRKGPLPVRRIDPPGVT